MAIAMGVTQKRSASNSGSNRGASNSGSSYTPNPVNLVNIDRKTGGDFYDIVKSIDWAAVSDRISGMNSGNSGDSGEGYSAIPNPVATENPQEDTAETPVKETPTPEATATQENVPNPIAESTEEDAKTEPTPTPTPVVPTDQNQHNNAFSKFINNRQTNGVWDDSAIAWNEEEKKRNYRKGERQESSAVYETSADGGIQPNSAERPSNFGDSVVGNPVNPSVNRPKSENGIVPFYAAAPDMNTIMHSINDYDNDDIQDSIQTIRHIDESARGALNDVVQGIILDIADLSVNGGNLTPLTRPIDKRHPILRDDKGNLIDTSDAVNYSLDMNGNVVKLESTENGIGSYAQIWDSKTGSWVPATYDPNTVTFSAVAPDTIVGSNVEAGSDELLINPDTGNPNPVDGVEVGSPEWQAAFDIATRRFDPRGGGLDFDWNTVSVDDTSVRYIDKSGDIHSIPLASEKGQYIAAYANALGDSIRKDPSEDEINAYADALKPLSKYAGWSDEDLYNEANRLLHERYSRYSNEEARYAHAIQMSNDYHKNNNYIGVKEDISEDEINSVFAKLKTDPYYAGLSDEDLYNEANHFLQGYYFKWGEELPVEERVPAYDQSTDQGNALFYKIMYDGKYVTNFSDADAVTYQDILLHYYDNPDYSNKGGLPTENGAGFSVNIPEECLPIIATSKYGANDERNGDNIETVTMSEDEYNELAEKFINANPSLVYFLYNDKLTVDAIMSHFLKTLVKPKYYGSYGGYYYRGGGGGYRGGGSYSSSNSAGSTTQNQQRVYNIMKNWSF